VWSCYAPAAAFSPRGYCFGITVPPEFRATDAARAALRRYHCTWLVDRPSRAGRDLPGATVAGSGGAIAPLAPLLAGMVAFFRERSNLHAAVQAAPSVTPLPLGNALHFPPWLGWALPPFAFPLATALYLHAHWDQIPDRFPIHWGASGQPNGWAHRTAGGVYGRCCSPRV